MFVGLYERGAVSSLRSIFFVSRFPVMWLLVRVASSFPSVGGEMEYEYEDGMTKFDFFSGTFQQFGFEEGFCAYPVASDGFWCSLSFHDQVDTFDGVRQSGFPVLLGVGSFVLTLRFGAGLLELHRLCQSPASVHQACRQVREKEKCLGWVCLTLRWRPQVAQQLQLWSRIGTFRASAVCRQLHSLLVVPPWPRGLCSAWLSSQPRRLSPFPYALVHMCQSSVLLCLQRLRLSLQRQYHFCCPFPFPRRHG